VVDTASGTVKRLGGEFQGSFEDFTLMSDGRLIASGLKGTQTQLYRIDGDRAVPLWGLPGTYAGVDSGLHSSQLLVRYSTLTQPIQVFVASDAARPDEKSCSSWQSTAANERRSSWSLDDFQPPLVPAHLRARNSPVFCNHHAIFMCPLIKSMFIRLTF
jgi:hypothetical protein